MRKIVSMLAIRITGEQLRAGAPPVGQPQSLKDIRTGKSPGNVIGQKYSPSVAKIPQYDLRTEPS
jgi:hypothetical protein